MLPGCTVQVPDWVAATVPETAVVPTAVAFTEKAVLSLAMATRWTPVPAMPLPMVVATPFIWATFTLWLAAIVAVTVPEIGTGEARSWVSVRPLPPDDGTLT